MTEPRSEPEILLSGEPSLRSAPPHARSAQASSNPRGSNQMADNSLTRFLGGPPVTVFVRLFFISLIVGALLVWLDIHPAQIIDGVRRFVTRIYEMGFDAVREAGQYILAGALIVVPVWLVLRLLNARGPR